jgi:hypothetical protein
VKNLSQSSRCPSRDANTVPPEYKSGYSSDTVLYHSYRHMAQLVVTNEDLITESLRPDFISSHSRNYL